MKIGICSDHAGFDYKTDLISHLQANGHEIVDFGTHSTASMDYPDVAHPLAEAVEKGDVELGIAMCGTGNGMQMSLNKHQGIRAGLCWSVEIGKLIKQHNNANVLVMPARFIPFETVIEITDAWLNEPFEGGRHQKRVDMIMEIEEKYPNVKLIVAHIGRAYIPSDSGDAFKRLASTQNMLFDFSFYGLFICLLLL